MKGILKVNKIKTALVRWVVKHERNFETVVRPESRILFLNDLEQCQYYAQNGTCVSPLNDLNISKEVYNF